MAYAPIKALYDSSSQREYYSHIVLIPLVSIYLIFQKRKVIFSEQEIRGRVHSPRMPHRGNLSVAGGRPALFCRAGHRGGP